MEAKRSGTGGPPLPLALVSDAGWADSKEGTDRKPALWPATMSLRESIGFGDKANSGP